IENHGLPAICAGGRFHYRLQIQVPVGNIHRKDSTGFQMPKVSLERFNSKHMHGYRIPGEYVDHQQIELLIGLAFERQAPVAQRDFDLRRGIIEIAELTVRELDHHRVDLVDPDGVAWASISRQCACAEPDDADPPRHARGAVRERLPDPAGRAEVFDGALVVLRAQHLDAVVDAAVQKLPVSVILDWLADVDDAQQAIEIAGDRSVPAHRIYGLGPDIRHIRHDQQDYGDPGGLTQPSPAEPASSIPQQHVCSENRGNAEPDRELVIGIEEV